VPSTSLPQSADSEDDDQLARIANDPGMWLHARRNAGDLAEDALQETWYLVAQACRRERIQNLRGYFYVTLVRTCRRMREELGRGGIPVDDPDAVAGAVPSALRPAPAEAGGAVADDSRQLGRPRALSRSDLRGGRVGPGLRWPGDLARDQ
jgi:DNA-directed RNA polymerase specialized sigma24 family protein